METVALETGITPEKLEKSGFFVIEKDTQLQKITSMISVGGLALGILFSTVDIYGSIDSEFRNKVFTTGRVTLSETVDMRPKAVEKTASVKPKNFSVKQGQKIKANGGGNSSVPTMKGVLGLLTKDVTSNGTSAIFGEDGFATGIDKVLQGVQGVSKGTNGGFGRRSEGTMLGDGFGSVPGFGGGDNGGEVNKLLGDLMGGGGSSPKLKERRVKERQIDQPSGASSSSISGQRSRSDIMRVVNQNMQGLRYIFNRFLRDNPQLKGKITIKWAIDEFGNVLFCTVTESNVGNTQFEESIMASIQQWKFSQLHVSGDVTEVVYPFMFTQ